MTTFVSRREYGQYFEVRERDNGAKYCVKKDQAPMDLVELIHDIHDEFSCYPNDWIYEVIRDAFDELEQDDLENITLQTDCYTKDLHRWLYENPFADDCCDEAFEEFEHGAKTIAEIIAWGQWVAKNKIYHIVNDFINESKAD